MKERHLMCTAVILRRPDHDWPLILGGNRDEMLHRPFRAPARHWEERPDIVGGYDELAAGSWLGINDYGVVATILNRPGTLGPMQDKRSRGELVLDALDHADAREAALALLDLDPGSYRPFNLVIADNREAFVLYHRDPTGTLGLTAEAVPEGLSMITAYDLNDINSGRIKHYRPLFEQINPPDPEDGIWDAWESLLQSHSAEDFNHEERALYIEGESGFGTASISIIALPNVENPVLRPHWRYKDRQTAWKDIVID